MDAMRARQADKIAIIIFHTKSNRLFDSLIYSEEKVELGRFRSGKKVAIL
jgi:hypothetical protein